MGKKGKMGKASVTSNVTNRVNTGSSQTSVVRTGATGDETNRIHEVTIQGTPGTPGRAENVVISTPGVPTHNLPGVQLPPNYQAGPDPTVTVFDQAQTHATNAFDQADIAIGRLPAEHQAQARAQLQSARTRVQSQLADARTRAGAAWSRAADIRRQHGR